MTYIASWTCPKLLLSDLTRRGVREAGKIEAVREKIQVKLETKTHALAANEAVRSDW